MLGERNMQEQVQEDYSKAGGKEGNARAQAEKVNRGLACQGGVWSSPWGLEKPCKGFEHRYHEICISDHYLQWRMQWKGVD